MASIDVSLKPLDCIELETGQAKLAVEAMIEEITAQLAAGNEVKLHEQLAEARAGRVPG
jgi:nucleoid DNA-binding protein